MTAFGRLLGVERRAAPVPFDPAALALPSNVAGAGGGRPVDAASALGIGTFYRGVELITNDVAYLPLKAVKQMADGSRVPFTEATAPGILTNPFFGLTLPEGLTQILTSLIMRGNAYGFPGAVANGEVLQWTLVSPDVVSVAWAANHSKRVYKLNGSVYNGPVMHIVGFMLPGAPTGISLLEAYRVGLGLNMSLADSSASLFSNGIMASGVITMDAQMNADNARAVAESFKQNHAGASKAHLPIVLGGGAKWTQISLTPQDSQFLESRTFQQGEIATILGIPPHMLGIVDRTTSWGTGIEAQNRNYYDHTLKPYVKRIEHTFTSWLPAGVWAAFDTDEIIRADTATRYANYALALNNGWMNVDEIRALEGKPPLPDGQGQIYRQSVQSIPLGSGEAAAEPTGQPATPDPAKALTTGGA